MLTSKELVYQTLAFANPPRAPRNLWDLPWAQLYYPAELQAIRDNFPDDMTGVKGFTQSRFMESGDPYQVGEYRDAWGCIFTNIQAGLIGEVKRPLILEPDWADGQAIHIPEEMLEIDLGAINQWCQANQHLFLMPGNSTTLFERLQFLRGTETLYMDLATQPRGMWRVIEKVHDFNCRLLTLWAQTDIDALTFSDDWGAQDRLLINPKTWVSIFKPLYKDYVDIAHHHGKKIFMHSDGHILAILPHLVDIGVDALNSQLFCMGLENVAKFKGQITFWGEIDRQYLLARASIEEVADAVALVKESLWDNGGCIAQCEFGAGARPEAVWTVFETWDNLFLS